MSLLTVVRSFCERTGLSVPSGVIGSTSTQVVQILGLIHELVDELLYDSYEYTALRTECLLETVEGADQGELTTLLPGFVRIIPDTMFNRTQNKHVSGPLSLQEWQALEAQTYDGTDYKYMIRSGHLYFMPEVSSTAAGDEIAFEATTSYLVKDSSGVPKAAFTADTDIFALPEAILLAGLRWKWREEKGLDFGSLKDSYLSMLKSYQSTDGTKRVIDMSVCGPSYRSGIVVPIQGIGQ